MKHNYHTHTYRCHHASGTEREYIETALRNGLGTLGFADHSPYIFPEGYYSSFRMFPEQTAGYYRTLGTLREEFKDSLEIRIGFEMEYYPRHFKETLAFMKEQEVTLPSGRRAGLEYLILGQHFIGNEYDGAGGKRLYSGQSTDDEAFLAGYVENVLGGLETGCFSYIAHPDLINYTGSKKIYRKHMRQLAEAAKATGTPLEINLLGLTTGRNYPNPLFWEIVAETGNAVVMGCDAHAAEAVGNPDLIRAGEAFAARFGLKIQDEVALRDPLKYLKD